MATEYQLTACDRLGRALAVIRAAIESVCWRRNGIGVLTFSVPWSDPACTRAHLRPGNRVALEFSGGLPLWGGVIDVPLHIEEGFVRITAYSGEQIFTWRATGQNDVYTSQVPGAIARARLDTMNATWETGIRPGTLVSSGDARTIEDHLNPLNEAFDELVRLSGQDLYILPSFSSGQLAFELCWGTPQGSDKRNGVRLISGVNTSKPVCDEIGPLYNAILVAGAGSTWGPERLVGRATDVTSRETYDYREYPEVEPGVSDQATLDVHAAALLALRKDVRKSYTLNDVLDKEPALFGAYGVGDVVGVELFQGSSEWAQEGAIRIDSRQWFPRNVCRLEVAEVP